MDNSSQMDVELCLPEKNDVDDPEISIVIPALNEQLTIGQFVDWCQEGLAKAQIKGEILIVDSSTDNTAEIALARGARVLKTPQRGLGHAYLDAIPHIRGKYVMMGDCDCTYDFRELLPFVEAFRNGYEFIMGSRFRGYIEPGSMPPLHRYLGTPVTTWILNLIYSSQFSDIHCGMRGITKDALIRMDIQSKSWEYASEMVLKSIHLELKTTEVPIRFLKDLEGRESHHKRLGWFSPWQAAWINLRTMFIYGAEFFLSKPGFFLLTLGLLLTVPLSTGPFSLGPIAFSLHWMLLGESFVILGLQCFYMSILAQVIHDYSGKKCQKWSRIFSYTRSIIISACLFLVGCSMGSFLIREYIAGDFNLFFTEPGFASHFSFFGLLLIIISFMNFTFTLLLHATIIMRQK